MFHVKHSSKKGYNHLTKRLRGRPQSANPTRHVSTRLDPAIKMRVEQWAHRNNLSRNAAINALLQAGLEYREGLEQLKG